MEQVSARPNAVKEWLLSLLLMLLGAAIVWGVASRCQGNDVRDCHFLTFALGVFTIPLLSMLASWQGLAHRLARTLVATLLLLSAYYLFVGHQDHPWFVQPPASGCDGPCFGWYTFELDPPYVTLLIISAIAASLGVILYCCARGLAGLRRKGREA